MSIICWHSGIMVENHANWMTGLESTFVNRVWPSTQSLPTHMLSQTWYCSPL